jgi:alpha/beta superfamily hydrolase
MNMKEVLVEIVDQGRLAGVLHLPLTSAKPYPIVIYCPGKNGERYEVHRLAVKFARRLAEQGIAFLRFDYYGLGLSDGHYHEMTTSTKVSNVLKAYEFVQTLPDINMNAISFLGFSDGARIALMAANRTSVDKLVFWSPLFYEFGGNFPGKRPRFTRHPKHPQVLVMPWAGLWVGMDFYRDLQSINIEEELKDFQGESLIVYGDDDPLIQEEFTYLQTNRCHLYQEDDFHQVKVVPGAGHLFTSRFFEELLMTESENWIKRGT